MAGDEHQNHLFPEEEEPGGRLILGPCLVCGLSALEAMQELSNERDEYKANLQVVREIATDMSETSVAWIAAYREKRTMDIPGRVVSEWLQRLWTVLLK